MTHKDIRNDFFRFFESKSHKQIPSASVVPEPGSDLLFTNAGMNPFKNIFLGLEQPKHKRIVNIQKCIRVSGKHNDLEDVGHDGTHHTFFEMMGTWSFGDYGKKETIKWAWELLTKVWQLPKEKLYATVYKEDAETFELWRTETDIDERHILYFGKKDNFWEMGSTGPCGPCTEIHMDLGEAMDNSKNAWVNADSSRYIELWNLVFIQFTRTQTGELKPLEKLYVDTGMGLERIACILQNKNSNYETDLFTPVLNSFGEFTRDYKTTSDKEKMAMHVIADHLRAVCVAIADGAAPSNEGRGYVVRRIFRRAMRYLYILAPSKINDYSGSLFCVADEVIDSLAEAGYPELRKNANAIHDILSVEQSLFARTIDIGIEHFRALIAQLKKDGNKKLAGADAFKLHDTYGFPLDLTQLLCREEGVSVDEKSFHRNMERQQKRSRPENLDYEREFFNKIIEHSKVEGETNYLGAEENQNQHACDATIQLIAWQERRKVSGGTASGIKSENIIFDNSVFYAEGGGQVGDQGFVGIPAGNPEAGKAIEVYRKDPNAFPFDDVEQVRDWFRTGILVQDTKKIGSIFIHKIKVIWGRAREGDRVFLIRDERRRQRIRCHHTATHLLHRALRSRFGSSVRQSGSKVEDAKLHFDFSHARALAHADLQAIEDEVRQAIRRNHKINVDLMPIDKSKELGAVAFFEEKYGDVVRVVSIGEGEKAHSIELCGGSHVNRTGELGSFQIVKESSSASGVRRITAVAGEAADTEWRAKEQLVNNLQRRLKVDSPEALESQIKHLIEANKTLTSSNETGEKNRLEQDMRNKKPEPIKNLSLLYEVFDETDYALTASGFREVLDRLKRSTETRVVFWLVVGDDTKCLCGVSKDLESSCPAGEVVRQVAKALGGKGGGGASFAQGGIKTLNENAREVVLGHLREALIKINP